MPWSAIVPDTSTTSPGCTARRTERRARRDDADTGGRDEQTVGRAAADDLGVAGDDLDARGPRRLGHVGHDRAQLVDREALFDDERGRQPRRLGALHREVVHRAVDGEMADRAAREAQRLHDERVGAEREPLARRRA